jgi:hypothetical protein
MTTSRNNQVLRIIGLILFVGTGFLYLASGLVAPLWGIALLWVIWLGLLWLLVRSWKRSAVTVLAIPFIAAAVWFLVISLGEAVFEWTA